MDSTRFSLGELASYLFADMIFESGRVVGMVRQYVRDWMVCAIVIASCRLEIAPTTVKPDVAISKPALGEKFRMGYN